MTTVNNEIKDTKDGPDLLEVALRILNEAYTADPAAMHALVKVRIPCNEALADHPTVQVGVNRFGKVEGFDVGIVGLLNGIVEAATGKRLAVTVDEEDAVRGFVTYTPPEKS